MTPFTVFVLLLNQAAVPHIKAAASAYEEGKKAQNEKQFQRSADKFRKAVEIEPTFVDAYEGLISVLLESGRRLDAAAAMTQFLEIQPEAVKYRIMLGQILLEQKQPEKALAQFSLALTRDPYNADGLLGFATAARQMGMKDRADEAMERGRKQYPQDPRFKSSPGTATHERQQ